MITDEMIEKVADAIRGDLTRSSEWSEVARGLARAALEAAYPLIAAKVLEEAAVKADELAKDFKIHCVNWQPSEACSEVAAAIRALKAKYEVSK